MKKGQQFCFTHSSGEDIYLFALHNNRDTEVLISNYGAILTSFKIKNPDGSFNDIVLGFDKMEDYQAPDYLKAYPWFGSAVGRYANRIKNASFRIDGKEYQLSKNNGNDQLHGGIEGFDKKVWQLVSFTGNTLKLSYTSPDGEEGFPGGLGVTVLFELNDDNEFSYEYIAFTDKATAINLTHHGYFNLNNGKGNIEDHELKIYSLQVLEQEDNLVATGRYLNVKDTSHDFTAWKKLTANRDAVNGYDQSFVVDKKGKAMPLVAEVYSSQSKLKLQVWSTEPVVHFYSGKWIPVIKGKNETMYGPYSALCLETHIHPNAINIPHFPNTILRPGEKYYQKTVYKAGYTDVK